MLGACASSLRLTARYSAGGLGGAGSGLLPVKHSHRLIKQRMYVFLPASFQELTQILQEAWTQEKERQRTIFVKLWERPSRKRFKRWIPKSSLYLKQRGHNRYIASKRRFLNAKQLLREHAHSRMKSFRSNMTGLWDARWKKVTLTEPAQDSWFDSNGYPKAARDKYGRFVNPWNSQSTNGMQSLWLFLKWRMERLYNTLTSTALLPPLLPKRPLAFQTTPPPSNKIRFTWIGHSTTLVELGGFTILTDPIFSDHAGPVPSWPMAVARHVPPPCTIDELPDIDVCVISHDHYDHLDQPSVLQLKDKVKYWAVPLGISKWLQTHCDVDEKCILEMTWWESTTLQGDLELVCAPAQHWCGRTMRDRNQRLWCSWVIRAGSCKFYFAGDTAYPDSFPLHRQIGDRLGPFNLAALPIGAYAPSYFMKSAHVHPTEAVKIHQDLRAQKSVAIHHGTFPLSEEAHGEPQRLLKEAAQNAGADFVVVPPGYCVVVGTEDEQTLPIGTETSETEEDQEERAECG